MSKTTKLIISIPLLAWGGSPKRILSKPENFSNDKTEKIIRFDKFLYSNSIDFQKAKKAGELSWLDIPSNDLSERYFIFSHLRESSGTRPIWYFFCMVINSKSWESIGSHARLIKGLGEEFPSKVLDFVNSGEAEIEIKIDAEAPIRSDNKPRVIPNFIKMPMGEALKLIESDFSLLEKANFKQGKVACNPACLSGEWTYVIQSRGTRIPLIQVEKESPSQRRLIDTGSLQKKEPRKVEILWGKIVYFICIGAVLAGMLIYLTHKAHQSNEKGQPIDQTSLTKQENN